MILTKKRVTTIEALAQRFGDPEVITRSQIMTALEEGLIPAFPYWLTDDPSLKVDRGSWKLPTPDEFTIAEKGQKATAPATRKSYVERGETAPTFLKEKVEKPAKVAKTKKKSKLEKAATEAITDVVAAPKAKRTKKSKSVPVPVENIEMTEASATV